MFSSVTVTGKYFEVWNPCLQLIDACLEADCISLELVSCTLYQVLHLTNFNDLDDSDRPIVLI
jgi:hypothetical protein